MVKVTERFYINADTHCYILQQKVTVKDENSKNFGKEIFENIGYYPTLEMCLWGILKTETREFLNKEEVNSLQDLKKYIKEKDNYLHSLKLDI